MHTVMLTVGPEYEDLELWYCKFRLEEAGFEVKLAGVGDPVYFGRHGVSCAVDGHVSDFPAVDLAGIVVPGGWAPDRLRREPAVLDHLRDLHKRGNLVAAIGHGASVLASAGLVRGRRMTSALGLRDDLVNAGADWISAPVVVDGTMVSGRITSDLPAFGFAMVDFLVTRYAGALPGV